MAQAGFDWLLIDIEHSFIGRESLRNIIMAVEGRGCVPIVRVREQDIDSIKLSLDCGAGGVVIPRISTRDMAAWAVRHTKYAPIGLRGVGPMRASRYGANWEEYLRRANESTLTIVQIEDLEGFNNLRDIITTPGLDGIFIGPDDLSQSIEFARAKGKWDRNLADVMDEILAQAVASKVPVGTVCMTVENYKRLVSRGLLMPTIGSDLDYMRDGAAAGRRQFLPSTS
jgi:2-keto-3-deoxy-L-rhamnonate aldolase RhmA